jgi:dUTP pyrophosphatase
MELAFLRMPSGEEPESIGLPIYATPGSAGMDLCAALRQPMVVEPGQRVMVPTGFAMAIPSGVEGQVRPRSGRAWRDGLTVVNAPGTIDSDYRGEVKALLINLGDRPVRIERGDRIAQLVIAPVQQLTPVEVGELVDTKRGAGGFGHTGDS